MPNNDSTICRNVEFAYRTVLGRMPDPRELEKWKKDLGQVPGVGVELSVAPVMTALIKELQSDSKTRRNLIEWGVLRKVFYGADFARAPAPPKERIDELEAEMLAKKHTFAAVERIALDAHRQAVEAFLAGFPASIQRCGDLQRAVDETRHTELKDVLARRLTEPLILSRGTAARVFASLRQKLNANRTPAVMTAVARCYAPTVASQVLADVYANEDLAVGNLLRPFLVEPSGAPMRAATEVLANLAGSIPQSGRGRNQSIEGILASNLRQAMSANKTGFAGWRAIDAEMNRLRSLHAGRVIASLFSIVRTEFPTVMAAFVDPRGAAIPFSVGQMTKMPPGAWANGIRNDWNKQAELIRFLDEAGQMVIRRERLCVNERIGALQGLIKMRFPRYAVPANFNAARAALAKCVDGLEIVNALELAYAHWISAEPSLRATFHDPSSELIQAALRGTTNVKLTPADWQVIASKDQRRIKPGSNLARFIAPLVDKPIWAEVEREYLRRRGNTVRWALLVAFKDALVCSPQIAAPLTNADGSLFKGLLSRFANNERLPADGVRAKLIQEQGQILEKLKVAAPNRDAAITALRREFATELDHYPSIAGTLLFDDPKDPNRTSPLRTLIKEMWGWCRGTNDPARLEKTVREKRGYFLGQLGVGADVERLKGEAVKSLIFAATEDLRKEYPGIAGYLMLPTWPDHPTGTRPNKAIPLMRKMLDQGVGGGGPERLRAHFANADARRKFVDESSLQYVAGTVLWMKESACVSRPIETLRTAYKKLFDTFSFDRAEEFGKWLEKSQPGIAKDIERGGKFLFSLFADKGACSGSLVRPVPMLLGDYYALGRQLVTDLVEAKTQEFDRMAARLNACAGQVKIQFEGSINDLKNKVEEAQRNYKYWAESGKDYERVKAKNYEDEVKRNCQPDFIRQYGPSGQFNHRFSRENGCGAFSQVTSALADADKGYQEYCEKVAEAIRKVGSAADARRKGIEEKARQEAEAKAPPLEKLTRFGGKLWTGLGQVFTDPQAAMSTLNSAMSDVLVEGGNLAKGIGDGLNKLGEITVGGLQAAGKAIEGGFNYVVDLGKNSLDFVGNTAKALWAQYGDPLLVQIKKAVEGAFDTIISPILNTIYNAVTSPVGKLVKFLGQGAIDCLAGTPKIKEIEALCGLVPPKVRGIFQQVKDFFTGAGRILEVVNGLAKTVESVAGLCPDPFAAMTSAGQNSQIAAAANQLIDAVIDQAVAMLRPALVGIVSGFVEALLKLDVVKKTITVPLASALTAAVTAAAAAVSAGLGGLLGPVIQMVSQFALDALHDNYLAGLISERVSDFVFDGAAIPVVNLVIPGAKALVRDWVMKPLFTQSLGALRPILSEPLKALCKGVSAVIPLDKLRDAARKLGAITDQSDPGPGDLIRLAVTQLADFAEKQSGRLGEAVSYVGTVFGSFGLSIPANLTDFAAKIASESGRRFGQELRLQCGEKQLKGDDFATFAKEIFDCIGLVAGNALQEGGIVAALGEIAKGATSKVGLSGAWSAFTGALDFLKITMPALPGKLGEFLEKGIDAGVQVFGRFALNVCSGVTRELGKDIGGFLGSLFECLGVGAQIGLVAGALDVFAGLGFDAIKGGIGALFGALGRAMPSDFNVGALLDRASAAAVDRFGVQLRATCLNIAFDGDWKSALGKFIDGVVKCVKDEAQNALVVGRNELLKSSLTQLIDAARGGKDLLKLQFGNLADLLGKVGLNFQVNFGSGGSVALPDLLKGVGANLDRYGAPKMMECLEGCAGKLDIGANVDWGTLVSNAGSCAGTALAAAAYDGTMRWVANEARSGTLKGAVVDNIEKLAGAAKLRFPTEFRSGMSQLTDVAFSAFATELETNPKCKPSCSGSADFSAMLSNAGACLSESAGEAFRVAICSGYRTVLGRVSASADEGKKAMAAFVDGPLFAGPAGALGDRLGQPRWHLKVHLNGVADATRTAFITAGANCCDANLKRDVLGTFPAVAKCVGDAATSAAKAVVSGPGPLVKDVVPPHAGPHEKPVGKMFLHSVNNEPIKNLLPEMEGSVLIQGGRGVPPVFTLTAPAIVYHTDAYNHVHCQPPGGGWTKVGTIYRASPDNHPWGVYRKRLPAGRFEAAKCGNYTAVFVKPDK